jgi:hypothetical protein
MRYLSSKSVIAAALIVALAAIGLACGEGATPTPASNPSSSPHRSPGLSAYAYVWLTRRHAYSGPTISSSRYNGSTTRRYGYHSPRSTVPYSCSSANAYLYASA